MSSDREGTRRLIASLAKKQAWMDTMAEFYIIKGFLTKEEWNEWIGLEKSLIVGRDFVDVFQEIIDEAKRTRVEDDEDADGE